MIIFDQERHFQKLTNLQIVQKPYLSASIAKRFSINNNNNKSIATMNPIKKDLCLLLIACVAALAVRGVMELDLTKLVGMLPFRNNVVIQPTFIFSAPRLEQIKTQSPANYNEVKAQALFDLFGPRDSEEVTEECCKEAEIWCRLRAVAPKYVPAFAAPLLLRSSAESKADETTIEEPIADFERFAVEVLEHAFLTKTTPAFLPSRGPMNADMALAFYQLMHGAFRNAEPVKAEAEMVHDIEQEIERCSETDTLSDILTTIFVDLPAATKIAKSPAADWLPRKPIGDDMQGLFDVAFSRFRKMPSVGFQYHLQGSLTYELQKDNFDYELYCGKMWAKKPALHPTSLVHRLFAFFEKEPKIKERSCFDANPFSSGMDPVDVATCNAYALDPEPVPYHKRLPRGERGPGFMHASFRKTAAPLIASHCHNREHVMFEFLQVHYDFADICTDLWARHPHTHPKAKRSKLVKTHDNTQEPFWRHEFEKQPLPLESFCLSFELDRNAKEYLGPFAAPKRQHRKRPKDVPAFLQLLHTN